MMTGELTKHLAKVHKTTNERINEIIKKMAKNENVQIHYDGKMEQLEWIGLMNNYKHCAEEVIYSELIYV